MSGERFPRRLARTRRFTLGQPRDVRVSADGGRVAFLRSPGGDDPANALWVLDVPTGEERCVADPGKLSHGDDLPPEERARRERRREQASGVVAYAADRAVTLAAFALEGRLCVADLTAAHAWRHPFGDVVVDPRPDPTGQRIAFVSSGGGLAVVNARGGEPQHLAGGEADTVTWGLADFIAAEEMGRSRGFWWSPDGRRIAATRVDDAAVTRWHVADPADPSRPATTMPYPAAGTENTDTQLHVLGLDGSRGRVDWDASAYPYLVDVVWDEPGPLTLVVQSRDQRRLAVLVADPDSGATRTVREVTDPHWVEIIPGVPRWMPDGRLVATADDGDTRRLTVDDAAVTPAGLQVRAVVGVDADTVTVLASAEPTAVAVWRVDVGSAPGAGAPSLERVTPAEGVHDARCGGGTVVVTSRTLDEPGSRTTVRTAEAAREVASHAERPALPVRVELVQLGDRALRSALLLPHAWREADGPLPVLLDPYGGPHAQRVLQHHDGFLVPQWFAEAGFAVLVADGRGSPGRGPRWERELAGDLATAPLEDQVDALHAAARRFPLDLTRVAIRGWSFGGYLAALAVLRRPDVFSAAVAGAPVTDWSLYDTHYTERYLGTPLDHPDAYARSSLLRDAAGLRRPLLLIHGLADDNVVAAHTLRLSRALLEAGRPHRVLPLSGVTHMAAQAAVAENLLLLQLDFLREALALPGGPDPAGERP